MRVMHRQAWGPRTFRGHPAPVLFAPSTVMGTVSTTACFFFDSGLANPSWASLRSGAVVILTSASRSGGEVRITEAQRPRHVNPGRRGCQAGIEARSARKLAVLLEREGTVLPVITVHRILLRHGLVLDRERRRQATTRFEREAPNQLWQMDFKGQKDADAAVGPLSVLDDHSRYLVALEQTGTTRGEVVRERLEDIFRSNGVPEAMLMDHGVPWWGTRSARGWTQLSVWLMEQGIRCCFSGIGHPQTQGKVERFHGALERARQRPGAGVWLQQSWLDAFRHEYNQIRPHEALAMQTPASRWHPSPKTYDPNPPEWDYGQTAQLRKVNTCGEITINDTPWRVSVALRRKYVQIQRMDQRIFVFYCKTLIREIDLGSQSSTAVEL